MLKNILNIEGLEKLTKKDQEKVKGGFGPGFCYMPNNTTCCCWFNDVHPNGGFICGRGRRNGPGIGAGPGICIYG